MKIIISHDVDHLYGKDHWRDFIYPKLWVRSTIEYVRREYNIKEWAYRMATPFNRVRHHINDVMEFDSRFGVPSTFFFGMARGLGMSYSVKDVEAIVLYVEEQGFDVGVHGICFDDYSTMQSEYNLFKSIIGRSDFGIRMHYVRFNEMTFDNLDKCGYIFDATEFEKTNGTLIKRPYKIKNMWEFPLTIMDGYLPKKIGEKKEETLRLIREAERVGIPYVTILFHDYQFCRGYQTEMNWYCWIIKWLAANGYEFISYSNAIKEMEKNGGKNV